MGTSYTQPTDRPSKIWCRTCQKYLSMESEKVGGCRWPPENVSTWAHGSCAHGAMVYVFDDVVPETPKSLTAPKPKWSPQCGNPECDGTCGDLRCIPPQPIAKRETQRYHEKDFPRSLDCPFLCRHAVWHGFANFHYVRNWAP